MKKESHGKSSKIKRIILILLVFLLLVIAFAYGFMLGTKYSDKNSTAKEENEIIDDDNVVEVDKPETTITKEDIENFLSPLVSGMPNYDLLMIINSDNGDETIFGKALQYLYFNNKYTKINDDYVFKKSDFKEVARKYLMKDDFDYIPTSIQITYDSSNQTFSSKLQFGLFGSYANVTKELENYSVEGNKIDVNYKVIIAYPNPENGILGEGKTYSYAITLERIDSELRIVNVVEN